MIDSWSNDQKSMFINPLAKPRYTCAGVWHCRIRRAVHVSPAARNVDATSHTIDIGISGSMDRIIESDTSPPAAALWALIFHQRFTIMVTASATLAPIINP